MVCTSELSPDNNMHAVLDHYSVLKKKVGFDVEVPDWTMHVDLFFVIFFSIEIILRILAEELVFFFGDDWKWSWLDMILVTSSVVELLVVVDASDVRMLRLLRILRMIRSVRLLRGFRLFSKFRLLTLAIQASLVPLTWACVLLLCMLYVASLVFVNGVSGYLMSGESDQEVTGILYSYFSGVDVTMLTLFMCISGGVSWGIGCRCPDAGSCRLRCDLHFVHCQHDADGTEHHRGNLRERRDQDGPARS